MSINKFKKHKNFAFIITSMLLLGSQGFSQSKDSLATAEFIKVQSQFYDVLIKSVFRELSSIDLGRKNYKQLFSFRFKITTTITLDSFQANHGTPASISTAIGKSIRVAIDSIRANKWNISKIENSLLLLPVLIANNPDKNDTLAKAVPDDRLISIFNFDDINVNGRPISRFWNIPFQCYVLHPIVYTSPYHLKRLINK